MDKFDFIIVGGGTAGCLLAERLASTPSKPKVALFEAGSKQEDSSLLRLFDRFSLPFTHPEIDHGYLSSPQSTIGNREIPLFRGRGMGGSSMINFQVWSLGSKEEFDMWARDVDGPEWAFDSVIENIKKVRLITDANYTC